MLKALGSVPSTSKMALLQLMNLVFCSLSLSSRNLRQEDHAETDSCDASANACSLLIVVYVMSDMFKIGSCTVRHLLPTITILFGVLSLS